MDYIVDDFIAKYSDVTLGINEAIKEANRQGGGKVIFKKDNKYVSGIIYLLSNVTLFFEKNAILKMTDDRKLLEIVKTDFEKLKMPSFEYCEYSGEPKEGFIRAVGQKNIGIEGEGIIDGNEEMFYGNRTQYFIDGSYYPRVPLIYIRECQNVKLEKITLRRSAFWTVHLVGSEDILIDGVYILNNLKMANCDGIDPDHCKNLVIKNCYIEAADDGIVFKTTRSGKHYGACENIIVDDCTIISTSAGIKFGTESVSDFKNIKVSNTRIYRSNRGISFQLRDEGNMFNIEFENIIMDLRMFCKETYWGKAEPIAITCLNRFKGKERGIISNIKFKNINADTENGIFIYTDKTGDIKDIEFKDVSLYIHKKSSWEPNAHDLRPAEGYGIIEGPLNAIYSKGAKNIDIEGIKYAFSDDFSSIRGEDVVIFD